ncbi:MAG: preprotein translocase subunit SecG [Oceanipulchritudo sp.]|jgi:preprotein translocase subunit SecG
MINILISLLTFVLIIISLFMVLVILMQRANTNSGMGSAFGGGVTESAFGAETTNVLTRATKWSAFAFFIISLLLYLLYMSRGRFSGDTTEADLPDIPVAAQAAEPAPSTGDVPSEAAEDAAPLEEEPVVPAP